MIRKDKKSKRSGKIKAWFSRNCVLIIIAILLLLVPVAVDLVYHIPSSYTPVLKAENVLSYLGVAFGLFGSAIAFINQKSKDKKEHEKKVIPDFAITVERLKPSAKKVDNSSKARQDAIIEDLDADKTYDVFQLTIKDMSGEPVRDIDLYDEYIAPSSLMIKNPIVFSIDQTIEEMYSIERYYPPVRFNFTCYTKDEILDKDKNLKFVQLVVQDADGQFWGLMYERRSDGAYVEKDREKV